MKLDADVIIVGSGPSGVQAARPLVEAGSKVLMIDVGNQPDPELALPEGSFRELRRGDANQHRYFLGPRYEGIAFGHTGPGAQLTPPRQFVTRDVDRLMPLRSSNFEPLESLAQGGLGAAWGAGCPPFDDADLESFPYDRAELQPHYESVAANIGISGAVDGLAPFFGPLEALQPAVKIDSNGEAVLERYARKRTALERRGLYLGRPWLAMLSRDLGPRSATSYLDLDFWSDRRGSVYRPRFTLDSLRRSEHFTDLDQRLAVGLESRQDGVDLSVENLANGEREHYRARRLILACGALGTTRLVLGSLGLYDRPVPLVCNPHAYIAMLGLGRLGQPSRDERHSLAQGCFAYAPAGPGSPAVVGHLYSYRSLMTFRLAKDAPLSIRRGLALFQRLQSSLAVLIIQHADSPTPEKTCRLERSSDGGRDVLKVSYRLSAEEQRQVERTDRAILGGYRRLGCLPLRTVRPGHASSTHYAGAFPMSETPGPLTTDRWAELRDAPNVFIADGAAFPMLPSKGPTFTLMAHAHRIGRRIAELVARERSSGTDASAPIP